MNDADTVTALERELRRLAEQAPGAGLLEELVAARLFPAAVEPARIGRFTISGLLGSGGMGTVYGAEDSELGKLAIKVVRRGHDSEGLARLRREAALLARLDHPHLVRLLDTGEHEGCFFLVMARVEGEPLLAWLATLRSWRAALELLVRAGEALAAAHAVGVVHRDFKPANVLVDAEDMPHVVDFGLARPLFGGLARAGIDYSITASGHTSGTPGYIAPELLAGARASVASDVYAYCVTTLEALERADKREAPPGALVDLLLIGVAPDPARRWSSMPELLARMREAMTRQGWRRFWPRR